MNLGVGGRATLTYTVTPSNASINTFSLVSSDPSTVAIGDGTIEAKVVGSATITATVGDVSDTCTVTVSDTPATGITWATGMTSGKDYKTMKGTSSFDYEFTFTIAPTAATMSGLSVTSDNSALVKVVSFSELDGTVTVVLKRLDSTTKANVNITVSLGGQSCVALCKCN